MKYIKRIAVILLIAIISICAVFYSYYGIKNGAVVFADDNSHLLTNDELDIAISSWLQSHGGNLFSPSNYLARKTYEAGLIHNFVYGIDDGYNGVRQHIKGGIGGNNELRFDFDGFILQRLNTWLNEKLQNGEFGQDVQLQENGMFNDEVDNELYSGYVFTDDDGNNCLVYFFEGTGGFELDKSLITFGTPYKGIRGRDFYVGWDDSGNTSKTFTLTKNNRTYNIPFVYRDYSYWNYWYLNSSDDMSKSIYCVREGSSVINDGVCAILYDSTRHSNNFSIGVVGKEYNNRGVFKGYYVFTYQNIDMSINDVQASNIYFYTDNNLNITNYPDIDAEGNLYITPKVKINGEYKPYIVNEGDTINNVINNYYTDSNTKDKTISVPSDNPNGGGSSDNPSGGTLPNWNNPYPNLSPDGNGGFNFNFSLPDLNIDWNISGLREKFPFSIPFDFIAFCRVLNAEPQTPEWSGTLTLPMVNYPFTFSLQQFDNVASLLRNMEFIGFCIALILATRALIKG